ncbi:unnamed protein product [Arabidopsis halleri]
MTRNENRILLLVRNGDPGSDRLRKSIHGQQDSDLIFEVESDSTKRKSTFGIYEFARNFWYLSK